MPARSHLRGQPQQDRETPQSLALIDRFHSNSLNFIMNIPRYQDQAVLSELFDDFLQSGGDWMKSTVVRTHGTENCKKAANRDRYMKYDDLVEKHGEKIAKAMRSSKERMEARRPLNEKPYIMKHPDMPELDGWTLVRVFDEATVDTSQTETSSTTLHASVDLNEQQTRNIMSGPCPMFSRIQSGRVRNPLIYS